MSKQTKSWVITLVGALFFYYSFFQVNMMSSLSVPLGKEFGISSFAQGLLSGSSFYANIIFLIPAGLMLDRFSIRKIYLWNFGLVILATVVFAYAPNIYWAAFARFLAGIMIAFGLIACMKLASLYIPAKHMALASSLIVTIGMLGGYSAQTPLMLLIDSYGWRGALVVVAFLGLVIMAIFSFVIKHPAKDLDKLKVEEQNVGKSLLEVAKVPQNWFAGLYTGLINLPMAIIGALLGTMFLTQVYGYTPMQASSVNSMLFFGMIFGSPFFGWLADVLKVRRLPMAIGAIICLSLMIIVLYAMHVNPYVMHILFFFIGFSSAAQVLGYPAIAESNKPHLTGTAFSLAAMIIMGGGYGLSHPFVGWLLDKGFTGKFVQGVKIYPVEAFRVALWTVPIGIMLSFVAIFFIKENKKAKATK